jgi:hypothetical protein
MRDDADVPLRRAGVPLQELPEAVPHPRGPGPVRKQDEFKEVADLLTQLRDLAKERGFFRAPEPPAHADQEEPAPLTARAQERVTV